MGLVWSRANASGVLWSSLLRIVRGLAFLMEMLIQTINLAGSPMGGPHEAIE